MADSETCAILNRLLEVVHRSLPMYFADVPSWTGLGAEPALETLSEIVRDQKSLSQQLATLILDSHCRVEVGEYPMEFTGLHDCALDYLIGRMIEYQKRDIRLIERYVEELGPDARAKALADEVLGTARGHLESLEELVRKPGLSVHSPSPEPVSSP